MRSVFQHRQVRVAGTLLLIVSLLILLAVGGMHTHPLTGSQEHCSFCVWYHALTGSSIVVFTYHFFLTAGIGFCVTDARLPGIPYLHFLLSRAPPTR